MSGICHTRLYGHNIYPLHHPRVLVCWTKAIVFVCYSLSGNLDEFLSRLDSTKPRHDVTVFSRFT